MSANVVGYAVFGPHCKSNSKGSLITCKGHREVAGFTPATILSADIVTVTFISSPLL